ncbi:hypothetical protein [Vulcanococcus sp.]|uniref:hypothetical protein n=1 Tax=Vulcanococcus sp. TaxID=2856995 RepID=UPI003C0D4CEF
MTAPANSYWDTRKQTQVERWLKLSGRPHMTRGTSPYRGVSSTWSSTGHIWRATLSFNGRRYQSGVYKTQEEAALAWNRMVLRVVGPGCEPRLNQVPCSAEAN